MMTLWGKNQEIDFFSKSLELTTPEQFFYSTNDGKQLAYWSKGYEGDKNTLQSRNAFIGSYAEGWTANLFKEIAQTIGGYPVQNAVCEELGLSKQSPADVAICKTEGRIHEPKDILTVTEIRMAAVCNSGFVSKYKFIPFPIGD